MQSAMMLKACAGATLLALSAGGESFPCRELVADFIVTDTEATLLELEDDIRKDLEAVGVKVTTRALPKDEFNTAMVNGDFNMAFSETWGPPYDPHSYAKSWSAPDEAHYSALKGLPEPNTQAALGAKIDAVLTQEDRAKRETEWKTILTTLHEQAIDLPFSGKRIPAVINRRFAGYTAGLQQFDYPVHTLRRVTGSRTATVAPGAQSGLFVGVGRLDPHTYRPNEFFANNWVYEGLVEYGPNGVIKPSLATSWTEVDGQSGGRVYTFTLRQGVKFHDNEDWNCAAAKLNFDHVLAPPLTTPDWHGWYGLPTAIDGWSCKSQFEFEVTTKDKYYPLLQELSYIRPLRMLSPAKFFNGATSSPTTANSCHAGWGDITGNGETITCKGITGIAGTGRWKYVSTTTASGSGEVQEVVFDIFDDHWDGAPPSDAVNKLKLVRYASAADVKAALDSGNLDLVVGSGVLDPADVAAYKTNSDFHVVLTEPLQNRIVILNSAKAPTSDLQVRKLMMHAVNKAAIIDKELAGMAEPVDTLFPKSAPYCHVDLTPRWDYDLEKARFLNTCPATAEEDGTDWGAILGVAAAVAVVMGGVAVGLFFYGRSAGHRAAKELYEDKKNNPMIANVTVGSPEAAADGNGQVSV